MSRLAQWKIWQGIPRAVWSFKTALERQGFATIKADFDEQHFGNVVVDMEREHCRIRIIKDRGQWTTFVRAGQEWFQPEPWCGLVRGALPPPTSLMTLDEQVDFVLTELEGVCRLTALPTVGQELAKWLHRWNAEWSGGQ